MLEDFVGEENASAVLRVFGLGGIEETSTAASGAAGGMARPAVPLASTSGKPTKKKRNPITNISI